MKNSIQTGCYISPVRPWPSLLIKVKSFHSRIFGERSKKYPCGFLLEKLSDRQTFFSFHHRGNHLLVENIWLVEKLRTSFLGTTVGKYVMFWEYCICTSRTEGLFLCLTLWIFPCKALYLFSGNKLRAAGKAISGHRHPRPTRRLPHHVVMATSQPITEHEQKWRHHLSTQDGGRGSTVVLRYWL